MAMRHKTEMIQGSNIFRGIVLLLLWSVPAWAGMSMVDTGQVRCSDNHDFIACPETENFPFFGQDAQYQGRHPSYQDNGDGTVTDLVTGLMWSKSAEETKVSLKEAWAVARKMNLAGYADWRVPNIKELYTLIHFAGDTGTPSRGGMSTWPSDAIPFINTDYFDFRYGNVSAGERYIDAQWLSATTYVSFTMDGMKTVFGVNFADGRIKGYGFQRQSGGPIIKKFYARYVRGPDYGANDFRDNKDGTVTDKATGLMWMKADSQQSMTWSDALAYAEHMVFAGFSDWRLPNAKELQYIVDYTRSPDTTGSPAIDPVFQTTSSINEAGQKDYRYFWTSTTHRERSRSDQAVYIAFGRAIGQMRGKIMDVHGAGAQRSDPKTGRAGIGRGPQGDSVRIKNFVRLVRGGEVTPAVSLAIVSSDQYPNRIRVLKNSSLSGHQPVPRRFEGNQEEGPGRQAFIRHHDRDGDNRVSRKEFPGPQNHFFMFDKNRDGYIDIDEAPSGPPPNRGGFNPPQ